MVNKTYAFGILATALIIAPTAAFAGDQSSQQDLNQNATAVGYGSQVHQQANQTSIQYQNRHYGGYRPNQSQRSGQVINQNGVATDGSLVDQNANQVNIQHQIRTNHH